MDGKKVIIMNKASKQFEFPPQDIEFGRRLKKICKDHHITQTDLCNITGLSKTMIYRWTNGGAVMKVHSFGIIVDALGLTAREVAYLLEAFWEEDK